MASDHPLFFITSVWQAFAFGVDASFFATLLSVSSQAELNLTQRCKVLTINKSPDSHRLGVNIIIFNS